MPFCQTFAKHNKLKLTFVQSKNTKHIYRCVHSVTISSSQTSLKTSQYQSTFRTINILYIIGLNITYLHFCVLPCKGRRLFYVLIVDVRTPSLFCITALLHRFVPLQPVFFQYHVNVKCSVTYGDILLSMIIF